MTLAAVKKLAIKLPLKQRMKLAEAMLETLPPMRKSSTLAELEARIDEVESGKVKPVSGKVFLAELEKMKRSVDYKRPRQRG